MKINKLVKKCHKIAVDKGFYECPKCEGTRYTYSLLNSFKTKNFCESCNGTGKNPKRNIGELLMLIVSELGEAIEAHRKNKFADIVNYNEKINYAKSIVVQLRKKNVFETYIKDTFEDELADTFIRLFDLCGYLEIDIEKFIKLKMEYNKTREHKHGKGY